MSSVLGALARTLILLIGLCALSLFDYLGFSSIRAGVIAMLGLALGWLFKEMIAEGIEYYQQIVPAALVAYSIILFLGEMLDINRSTEFEIERIDRGEYLLKRTTKPRNQGLVKLLLSCPVKNWFQPLDRAETTDDIKLPTLG